MECRTVKITTGPTIIDKNANQEDLIPFTIVLNDHPLVFDAGGFTLGSLFIR